MKNTIENGKWKPENGTFVKVPNEQIPEVIQVLRENGQPTEQDHCCLVSENCVYFEEGEWDSTLSDRMEGIEIQFPDFKALVTGKLPESWCIQCTQESMKHEAFDRFLNKFPSNFVKSYPEGWYFGLDGLQPWRTSEPFGEVLQIKTWAALQDLDKPKSSELYRSALKTLVNHRIRTAIDNQLIDELKSRGYTISKIY